MIDHSYGLRVMVGFAWNSQRGSARRDPGSVDRTRQDSSNVAIDSEIGSEYSSQLNSYFQRGKFPERCIHYQVLYNDTSQRRHVSKTTQINKAKVTRDSSLAGISRRFDWKISSNLIHFHQGWISAV